VGNILNHVGITVAVGIGQGILPGFQCFPFDVLHLIRLVEIIFRPHTIFIDHIDPALGQAVCIRTMNEFKPSQFREVVGIEHQRTILEGNGSILIIHPTPGLFIIVAGFVAVNVVQIKPSLIQVGKPNLQGQVEDVS